MKNGTYEKREDTKSLAKVQDWLSTPCVKFGKPAPKFEGPIKTRPTPISRVRDLQIDLKWLRMA